jgi:hypothetical protein
MKIGLHANLLDHRGNSTVIYDYAMALRKYFGYETCVVSSRQKSTHPMERFKSIGYSLYDNPSEITSIVEKEKIDVMYMTTAGADEGFTPKNCKTAIHCVFNMEHQFGDVYAGVSEWLANRFNKPLWVPHIINLTPPTKTLHQEFGIPEKDFVVGRLGGYEQFNVPFVYDAIQRTLNIRKDIWFVFLNTEPKIQHERVKYIPFQPDPVFKSNFIFTCDAMLHARMDGETFGLAVGEFSSLNKPVLTYDATHWWYMRAHLHMLGEKAITYKNEEELLGYLLQIDKNYVKDVDWDCYSKPFSPENVIKKFNDVFIK